MVFQECYCDFVQNVSISTYPVWMVVSVTLRFRLSCTRLFFSCFRNSLLWSSNTLTQLKLVYMKASETLLSPDTIHSREGRWNNFLLCSLHYLNAIFIKVQKMNTFQSNSFLIKIFSILFFHLFIHTLFRI